MSYSSSDVTFCIEPISKTEGGMKYKISIKLPMKFGWMENINFVVEKGADKRHYKLNFKENTYESSVFENTIELETCAIYRYYFSLTANGKDLTVSSNGIKWDTEVKRTDMWKMSVNFEVPSWAKGKLIYHIFIDRFYRGSTKEIDEMPRRSIHKSWDEDVIVGPDKDGIWNNDFFGGDLKGIIEKLDYIKSLGVSILYLSPVCYSQSTHRYDTGDYEMVDPYAGLNEDLKTLCDEAHKRGMKVILDGVFNHTGNDSIYFNEFNSFKSMGAYQSPDSPYLPFYRYHLDDNGIPEFEYWWGMNNLPVCNGNSKEWKEYITGVGGVIDKWFNLGIDGLRLDVADELTDEFIELIRVAVKRNKKDGFILGEVWKNPMRMGRSYIESGKGMDSVMNYNLISSLIKYFRYGNSQELISKLDELKSEYPDDTIYSAMNFTSTHDITRGINLWDLQIFDTYGEWPWNLQIDDQVVCKNYRIDESEYERIKEIYMAYVFCLAFMPGNLSIFYGDEAGLQGIGNLYNRRPFPWNNEDDKLVHFFRFIGEIRKMEPFMESADFRILEVNSDIISFERIKNLEKMFVAINRSEEGKRIEIPEEYSNSKKVYKLKKSNSGFLAPKGGIAIKKT